MLADPTLTEDRRFARADSEAEAREMARRLNQRLNELEGPPECGKDRKEVACVVR